MVETGGPTWRGGSQALVGRDREVAELVAGLEDAADGRGRLLLITGDPGIGKTWLAEHLAVHARQRGIRVLWGRCWEGGGAPPFWPWAQLIEALAEGCDDQTLASYLGPGLAHLARVIPGLAERLGATTAPAVAGLESDAGRFYLFEAVSMFRRVAAAQPLLLVFDDLHAADDSSMLLLEFLVRQLRGSRLLVVGTYREVEAARSPVIDEMVGDLLREGQLLSLRGLDRDGVRGLIEELLGVVPSEATLAALHQATEGNPLFVREAVRLLATEASFEQPGRLAMPIPRSVQAVIQRRLAPLSADAVQVLSAAAVIGREFDLPLLGPASELPVERVLDALSEAVALGIVAKQPGTAGRYRFSHSLIREVLYERLPIPVRVQLHRRVGEAIEGLYGPGSEPHVAELARHFAEVAAAGEAAKALAYARQAGKRAMDTCAYEEAAAEYRRALHALQFAGPDEPARCELLLQLGAAQARAGSYQQAKMSFLQAAQLSRKQAAPERLARAALGYGEPQVEGGLVDRRLVALLREALDGLRPEDSPLRARLLARLSLELTFSDDQDLSEPLSLEAVAMARRLADPATLQGALAARWMTVWGPGRLEQRAELAGEVLQLARATGDRELDLLGRAFRATSSLESGDIRAVEAAMVAHARLVDELPMAFHQWAATSTRAMLAVLQGFHDEAERLADQALSLQLERPNVQFAHLDQVSLVRLEQGRLGELQQTWWELAERFPDKAFNRAWHGLAEAEVGDEDEARRALRSLIERLPAWPRDGLWLPALALAALLAARLDDPDAAERLYPVLLAHAADNIAVFMPHPILFLGSASFYLGLLAALTSRWEEADTHYEAALRAHDQLGARPFLARTGYEYARMLLRRGRAADRGRAVELLDRALATARSLGIAAVAQGIEALGPVQAGGTPPPEPAAAAPVPEAGRNVFRQQGEYWTVAYEGSVVHVKDAKGLRHLARLLAHPGREFHAVDLEAADSQGKQATPAAPQGRADGDALEVRPDLGDAGELLDATAKAAYKARLDELRAELEEAENFNDPTRATKAREEMDFLVSELARAVGLGGRDRHAASHAERARLNATRAVRAAMANLARANPSLGQHLSSTIRTGRYCSYTPDPRVPVAWEV